MDHIAFTVKITIPCTYFLLFFITFTDIEISHSKSRLNLQWLNIQVTPSKWEVGACGAFKMK